MRTFLQEKTLIFNEFREEIFRVYPQKLIEESVIRLLMEIKDYRQVDQQVVTDCLMDVLSKTETYNVISTILQMEIALEHDEQLIALVKDPSFNVHRTIAMSICGMYGSGAISFFGFVDCKFRVFFPYKHPRSFLSKGICAIVASTATLVIGNQEIDDYTQRNLQLLSTRGITLDDITEIVDSLQRPYNPQMDIRLVEENVIAVLRKKQTHHAIRIAVYIDAGVENNQFTAQYNHIVAQDEGLFGVDESVATAIPLCYGTIALTNFGYLDKQKPGIISDLDSHQKEGKCHTFMDDIICGIASAACGRLAHNNLPQYSKPVK
jgi:phosphatidylglycerophosphatase A